MRDESHKKLLGRINRLTGQARSLGQSIVKNPPEAVVTQFEALIAATKASLVFYLQEELLTKKELSKTDQKLLSRLISKF